MKFPSPASMPITTGIRKELRSVNWNFDYFYFNEQIIHHEVGQHSEILAAQ